jgi:hypothetical protein
VKDDFIGDMHTDLARGAGLVFEPLAMTLDIAQSHLRQRLFVDHCGCRQSFKVIERHNVQGGARSFGQCGATVVRAWSSVEIVDHYQSFVWLPGAVFGLLQTLGYIRKGRSPWLP